MSAGLRELTDEDVQAALEGLLAPRLTTLLRSRRPGHCARTTDIDGPLAVRLCRRIRAAIGPEAQVVVLAVAPRGDMEVTSTKLVELRNPEVSGRQRPPLLVFVPPGVQASAEDSFGAATFEQVDVGDVYADLADHVRKDLPADLRDGIDTAFAVLDEQRWPHADALARARYLLTVVGNDHDPAAAGAALFELGLVPDFDLYAEPTTIRTWVTRNLHCVRTVTDAERPARQRFVGLGLTDADFRARLASLLADSGARSASPGDPRDWARRIVVDKANWPLAFRRWPLQDSSLDQAVRIEVKELPLPRAGDRPTHAEDPFLQNIAGQHYLPVGRDGMPNLKVTFDVHPDPRRIAGLAKFAVQIVPDEGGSTGVVGHAKVSVTAKTTYSVTLRGLRAASLEPGWHYVRVLPMDTEGIPLPVEPAAATASGHEGPPHALPANESNRFFVVPDGDIDEPEQQRARRDVGLTHAMFRAAEQALADGRDWRSALPRAVAWRPANAAGERHAIHASFGRYGNVEIVLSPTLTEIQRNILANPERTACWRLAGTRAEPIAEDLPWPAGDTEPVGVFRSARAAVLAAVRGVHGLVVEGRDLRDLRDSCREYAESYAELLAWQLRRAEGADSQRLAAALAELGGLLRLDSVTVVTTGRDGLPQEVVLVAPTHPLRLLWLVAWAHLAEHWLDRSTGEQSTSGEKPAVLMETLLQLSPLGFPLTVPRVDGRLVVAADDLTPYWSACLPSGVPDPQSLMATVAAALRLSERSAAGAGLSGRMLADRVERYVRLHPYLRTLTVNVVNPGSAEHLADMLVDLQGRPATRDIAYDLRLFTADPQAPGVAAALSALLDGERSSSTHAEAFHSPNPGLIPKLGVSIRPLTEFGSTAGRSPVHLTMLFDAFGGERIDAAPSAASGGPMVYGLRQDLETRYVRDGDVVSWQKLPRHRPKSRLRDEEGPVPRSALPNAVELSDLLSTVPPLVSAAAAAVTTGQVTTGQVPRISLSLDLADRALLHWAHTCSDWVITADRALGVDYFDQPSAGQRGQYVIDYDGEAATALGHRIVISSQSVDELRALLEPAAKEHGLPVEPRHIAAFFDQLRLLSGRLALKLASATTTQRTEALGLALARLYLDYHGALHNQILVPLDDHLELYRHERGRADEIGEQARLHRTDLALFGLDRRRRLITCRLVEVKCYTSLPGLPAYLSLQEKMSRQLAESEAILAERFDPHHTEPDRVDRLLQNYQLATLLRTYLRRARRHRIIGQSAAIHMQQLLDDLDAGYSLVFRKSGLVFDLGSDGDSREFEAGIEFHRIGRGSAHELIEAIATDPAYVDDSDDSVTLAGRELSVPKINAAAFLEPTHDHVIAVESAEGDDAEGRATSSRTVVATVDKGGPQEPVPVPEPRDVGGRPDDERGTAVAQDAPPPAGPPPASPAAGQLTRFPDIVLGASGQSPQYGLLGESAGRWVALDLNETHTISLFGVQGSGKSYTLGAVVEMATMAMPPINQLPRPLATIVFHYSPTRDYAPEFTSMVDPNDDEEQARVLRERYGVSPVGVNDVVLLVPSDQVDERSREYPDLRVLPLRFGVAELRAEHWRFLMGAVGNQSTYIRQLQRIMRAHRNDLSIDVIRRGVDESGLPDHLKQLAHQRLNLAADYLDDSSQVRDLVRPGRLIIVDLRDEFIEKDEALGLFVVLMQIFAEAQDGGSHFNKLVVFDEAHKYIDSPDLVAGLVESVREMRHKGMSVLVASQDPPSVPISLIELSDHIILHRFTSPAWLRHLQKANAALADLSPAKLANLVPGEAYVWASKATEASFTKGTVKIRGRVRVSRHGGETKTAVGTREADR